VDERAHDDVGTDDRTADDVLTARERALRSRPRDGLEAEGVPDLLATLPGKDLSGDAQEGVAPPGDRPRASIDHGTTAAEQRDGERLGDRLARERPDGAVHDDLEGETGRLVAHDVRVDGGLTAEEADLSEVDLTAEEAAVRVVEEP
jgi:hypothetical protein